MVLNKLSGFLGRVRHHMGLTQLMHGHHQVLSNTTYLAYERIQFLEQFIYLQIMKFVQEFQSNQIFLSNQIFFIN